MKMYAVLLLSLLSAYAVVSCSIFSNHDYRPCWSDECVYYLNALSSAKNNSLADAVIQDGVTSVIGQFGPHGFMCTLIDGLWMKLFGDSFLRMIAFNYVWLLGALLFIASRSRIPLTVRAILCFSTLAPAYTFLYICTFMQETLNLAIAAILTALITECYLVPEARRRSAWLLVVIATVAVLTRPHWLLLLVMFIPLAQTRKTVVKRCGLFAAGVALMFALFKLFLTTYPDGFLYRLGLIIRSHHYGNSCKYFFDHFFTTLSQFFIGSESDLFTNLYKALFLGLTIRLTVLWLKNRDGVAGGIALFALMTLALLLCVYDCLYWREVRFLGPLLPLLISTCMIRGSRTSRFIITACSVIVLVASFNSTRQFFDEHLEAASLYAANQQLVANCKNLRNIVAIDKNATVNVPLSFYAKDIWSIASYPVESVSGHSIRYSVAFDKPNLLSPKLASYLLIFPGRDGVSSQDIAKFRELERNDSFALFIF